MTWLRSGTAPAGLRALLADDPARFRTSIRSAFALPFAICFVISIATLPLSEDPFVWQVGVAFALQAALGVALWRVGAGRTRAVVLAGIVVCMVSIALLRSGLGGASGYGALVLLPVMWAALIGRRLDVLVAIAGAGLVLIVPLLLVGAPDYPEFVWRGGALLLALAATLGLAIHALMTRLRGELRHSAAILASMSEGFMLTRDGEILSVNQALCEMTGLSERDLVGARSPYPFWPADLRETIDALREKVLAEGAGEFEVFLVRADGTRFPAAVTAAVTDVGDGGLTILNTVRDITERREHDEAVQRNAEQLAAIAEVTRAIGHSDPLDAHRTLCRIALQVCDGAHAVSIWQQGSGGRLFTTSVLPESSMPFAVPANDRDHGARVVFRTGRPLFVPDASSSPHCDRRIVERLGSASVHFHPVADAAGVRGVLAVNWPERLEQLPPDIAPLLQVLADEAALALQRAELLIRLDELTRTDELTGLPNRRAWDDVIEREMDHALRRQQPLSVAMLDLDHFKTYNDEYGHLGGDQLLCAAAEVWSKRLRNTDVLARWGGEEFALLLPDCDARAATQLLERLRGCLPGGTTFSAGVAFWDGRCSPAELVRAADHAMYAAKARGRDRVEVAVQES